jgi:hypothetical protein
MSVPLLVDFEISTETSPVPLVMLPQVQERTWAESTGVFSGSALPASAVRSASVIRVHGSGIDDAVAVVVRGVDDELAAVVAGVDELPLDPHAAIRSPATMTPASSPVDLLVRRLLDRPGIPPPHLAEIPIFITFLPFTSTS